MKLKSLVAIFLLIWCTDIFGVVISINGQAQVQIVMDENADVPVHYAAEELARFLKEVTGADFRIGTQLEDGWNAIYVGTCGPAPLGDFQNEEIGILTQGDDLYLSGGGLRGPLYAVYTFLEDYIGCHWWSSQAQTIPKRPTLGFVKIDHRFKPVFEFREPFWTDAFDGAWAARNKCNGHSQRLTAQQGGRHVYEGFVHTFYSLIPPDRYFAGHPEWFSQIDGKRTHDRSQLCLTNDTMRVELTKNLKERLRVNPSATIASVSQNDWHGNCQCEACQAIEQEEESPAGLVLRFVNQVAADIEQEFPNVEISTLAYQYTRKPPKITRPRPNVIVRLCSIECSFSVPLADERNQKFRDDIVGWSQICNRLYVWDYTTNFRHYFLPHPNLGVLAPNVKFFADHHVVGLFEQGAYTSPCAEMAELRAWVLARLLWNPNLDGEQLIDEFLAGYYGAAADEIKAYLTLIHQSVIQSGDWLGCFSPDDAKFLNYDTLAQGWMHLQAAEAMVSDNTELVQRVQVAQLPVMYAVMRNWKKFQQQAADSDLIWPMAKTPDEVYEQFMQIARDKKVTRLNEWQDGFALLDDALKKAKQ